MARKARKELQSSIFSIRQVTDVSIFRDKKDREAFVEILEKSKDKFDFDIYGYCLLDANEFWIILNAKNRSISTIMQSISISYARYRNDVKNLFTRRYKSDPLYSVEAIEKELNELKSDERYKKCSYCFYNPVLNQPYSFISKITPDVKMNRGRLNPLSMDEFEKVVNQYEGTRNDIIREVYANYNVTQKQLGDYFEINKSTVSKILSEGQMN